MKCRHCGNALQHQFLDLGFAPPSNAYLNAEDILAPESYFPLKLHVCEECWLVQTVDYSRSDELFTADYAYFSSTSSGWMKHARDYCAMITERLQLNEDSFVIEVASNDGYLLRNFVDAGTPCLGIEPTDSTADAAELLGIPVQREFFQFDTVYHEHYSYLSLNTVQRIFKHAGLRVYDVEQLSTHGGSLRVYGCHQEAGYETCSNVNVVLQAETDAGLKNLDVYLSFQFQADRVKNDLLAFLIEQHRAGKSVAAYGAAAKGNTLLNYAGVKPDLLSFVCDAAEAKQGKFMPGSHIPIFTPEAIAEKKPDYVVILPWNIAEEVMKQNACIRDWGGKFVTAVPELKISRCIWCGSQG